MRSDDEGFTLIELMVAIAILGIVMSSIVSATVLALHAVSGRSQAVTDTAGGELLTSYLVTDAQSADHVNPASLAATNPDSFSCGTSPLLELRWTDADGATGTTDVVYSVESAGSADSAGNMDYQLVRRTYSVNVSTKSCGSATSQTILAPNVSNASTNTFATCDTASCDDTATRVGLTVQAFSNEPKSGNYAAYTYTVYGARRVG